TATPPLGLAPPESEASVSVPFTGAAALRLAKDAHTVDVNANGALDAGDRIDWTFVVTNVGPIALVDIAVADPVAGQQRCTAGRLAPGASVRCTATALIITAAQVAAGHLTNVATATGRTAGGRLITAPQAHTTVAFGDLPVTGTSLAGTMLAAALLI